jgi:hypothetical protein
VTKSLAGDKPRVQPPSATHNAADQTLNQRPRFGDPVAPAPCPDELSVDARNTVDLLGSTTGRAAIRSTQIGPYVPGDASWLITRSRLMSRRLVAYVLRFRPPLRR